MKKLIKGFMLTILVVVIMGIYYYVTLPAISFRSPGLWWFIITALLIIGVGVWIGKSIKEHRRDANVIKRGMQIELHMPIAVKCIFLLAAVLFVVYIVGCLLSSPILNAGKYQKLLTVEERNFTEDIAEADFNKIPLLDKESASILGERKMGSMVEMVSQFEVGDNYTQINLGGTPVRVTPLVYASFFKWLTNQSNGIPAYIKIDMATQNTECVKLPEGQEIKYSESELFNRNIYRHLRFNYPTYIFHDQIFFEIGEDGVPYWVCPVKKYNVGLFGGETVGRVVICNASTGECTDYAVENVPQWVDKVYQAELLTGLYDYYGTLKHGFLNSVFAQKDCLQTTNGYNYIAMDDDVWLYSGVTSVSGDQSNVGFVLMNQRTMETRFYKIEGAIEDSAMSSAEGQVQNLGYLASFPLLVNVSGEPTYFMALKDDAGLVKKYAMVNIQKYQWVAIGDNVNECRKNYTFLLRTNGITGTGTSSDETEAKGKIKAMAPIVIENNTHYYMYLEENDVVYDFDMTNTDLLPIITYQAGDAIKVSYVEEDGMRKVQSIIK